LKWLRRGAQPSDTAKRLLSKSGIWKKFTYEKLGKPLPSGETVEETDVPEDVETPQAAPQMGTLLTEASPEPAEEK